MICPFNFDLVTEFDWDFILYVITGVSSYSTTSEISCDYVDPPEETSGKSDSDSSEPEQKLLKYAADNHKQVSKHKGNKIFWQFRENTQQYDEDIHKLVNNIGKNVL